MPAMVPVTMRLPGSRVMPSDRSAISRGMSNTICPVLSRCLTWPPTSRIRSSACGSGTSFTVARSGPAGAKVLKALDWSHGTLREMLASCRSRAVMSLRTV